MVHTVAVYKLQKKGVLFDQTNETVLNWSQQLATLIQLVALLISHLTLPERFAMSRLFGCEVMLTMHLLPLAFKTKSLTCVQECSAQALTLSSYEPLHCSGLMRGRQSHNSKDMLASLTSTQTSQDARNNEMNCQMLHADHCCPPTAISQVF